MAINVILAIPLIQIPLGNGMVHRDQVYCLWISKITFMVPTLVITFGHEVTTSLVMHRWKAHDLLFPTVHYQASNSFMAKSYDEGYTDTTYQIQFRTERTTRREYAQRGVAWS